MEAPNRNSDSCKKKKMMEMKKKMNNMTREQLKAAIEKKKLCNAKAMTIVERLIEPNVEETWLLESLYHINQSHYQDAVEERAIIKCCGYPICDALIEEVPKKQYHISTKQNKVFDITDRKNYCSNICYKASIYLKEQMYTSPLWLRDCEDVVEYKLLLRVNKYGPTGVEIDLGNISPVKADEANAWDKSQSSNPTNITSILEQSIECNHDKRFKSEDFESENHLSVSMECIETKVIDNMPANVSENDSKTKKQKVIEENDKSVFIKENTLEAEVRILKQEDVTLKQKSKEKRNINRNKLTSKKRDSLLTVGYRVDCFLDSWFTADSLRFLYGDDKVKEIFEEFGTPTERFGELINTKDAFMYERYTEICKRLNFIELKEKIKEREEPTPSKPIPDYEALKNEARSLEIKVRSFYLGDKKVSFQNNLDETKENKNKEENECEVHTSTILPLVDKHCVLATRRRIVLDKLFKTLPDIQSALGLSQFNFRHEIQEFVHTLALTASNIALSPTEWNLVAMVVIKLFTLRNEILEYAFKTDLTQKRIINLLLSYRLDLDYLQRCVSKLKNIEQIIQNSL